MNIDYILSEKFIKLNNKKVYLGEMLNEIEKKIDKSLLIAIDTNTDGNKLCSEGDFQMHFNNDKFYMWVISPRNCFFTYKLKKKHLRSLSMDKLINLLYEKDISWNFDREYTCLNQVSIKLDNNVYFIFGFDEDSTNGYIGKVGLENMEYYQKPI